MVGLAATGELSYNGYTFDGASEITVAISYIYDDAERTIIGQRHLITVKAIVANGSGLDNDLESIRRKLGQSRKRLIFVNKGFGDDFRVSGVGLQDGLQGGLIDSQDGPKPRTLLWSPVGDDKAAEVIWTVEANVALCNTNVQAQGLASLNYGVSYAIDSHGMTTRTIQGAMEIVRRVGNDTVDLYRERLLAPAIPGFKRTQNWIVAANKRKMEFTITDTEIASNNPYPQFVTAISGSHRFSYRRGAGGIKRQNVISVRTSPDANINGAYAWLVFQQIVASRVKYAQAQGQTVFLDSLEIEEDLFGREHSMSVSYRNLKTLDGILKSTGLWQPISRNDTWERWALSLNNSAFNYRGSAGMYDSTNAVIIDLCEAQVEAVNNAADKPRSLGFTAGTFINKPPPKDKSYIDYRSVIMPTTERSVTRQQILQSPVEDTGYDDIFSQIPTSEGVNSGVTGSGVTVDVIQEDTQPADSVIMRGSAIRAGYQVPRPSIKQVADRIAHPKKMSFAQALVGEIMGVKVWTARWQLEYVLDKSGTVPIPPNRSEK